MEYMVQFSVAFTNLNSASLIFLIFFQHKDIVSILLINEIERLFMQI